jgi:hypothetical protein
MRRLQGWIYGMAQLVSGRKSTTLSQLYLSNLGELGLSAPLGHYMAGRCAGSNGILLRKKIGEPSLAPLKKLFLERV